MFYQRAYWNLFGSLLVVSSKSTSLSSAFAFCTSRQTLTLSSSLSRKVTSSTTAATSTTTQITNTRSNLVSMAATTVDDDIASWVSSAGYGEVTSSQSIGSSGWASFRKVEVSQPPQPNLAFFVKTSRRSAKEMFEGEALGLQAMYEASKASVGDNNNDDDDDSSALCIPQVFHWGDMSSGNGSFLIMEYLKLGGRSNDYALGKAMAHMHLADPTLLPKAGNPDGKFGFNLDNTIGGTPQPNPWTSGSSTEDWIVFFRDQRIGHQLQLAGDAHLSELWDNDIAPRLGALFENITVKPSLLHGDLWSGNIGSANGGKPSIFDPAVYWGHHEAEWGMSWCASFGKSFWDGYRSVIPEDPGFRDRKPLYDAYHQLNHYNLFGGGYLNTAESQILQVKRTLDEKKWKKELNQQR